MEVLKILIVGAVSIFAAIIIWKFLTGLLKVLLIGALAVGVFQYIRNLLN